MVGYGSLMILCGRWGNLARQMMRFYPGIENLILPMLSYPRRQVRHHVKLHLSVFRDFCQLILK